MQTYRAGAAAFFAGLIGTVVVAAGQLAERPLAGALTHPAIQYAGRPTTDAVADLSRRVDEGSAVLAYDAATGYLPAVLTALHVPIESQLLVMSKTGIQALYTTPDNPRAIFFNDSVTVGYIRGAPLLELAVQDPTQGEIFYTVDQKPQSRPVFARRPGCLTCHQAYTTLHVPGLLARSVYIAPDGLPLSQFGSFDPDDRTPFRQRWGGWYVTGTHGSMRHLGNAIVTKPADRDTVVSDRTLNQTSLEGRFDRTGYLSPHSDIAALMVFHHQVRLANLITRVGWESRIALHDGQVDLSTGSIADGINELVDDLLFIDEAPIDSRIAGTSGFADVFAARGPVDRKGRSLRQLDLERRLARYRCSYMIYSPAFASLPSPTRQAIYARLNAILSGASEASKYSALTREDRRAVIEILTDTLPDLPPGFGGPRS